MLHWWKKASITCVSFVNDEKEKSRGAVKNRSSTFAMRLYEAASSSEITGAALSAKARAALTASSSVLP